MNKKIEIKKVIMKLTISLIVIAIFAILLLFLFDLFGIRKLDEKIIQEKIASLGFWGPFAYILLSFLQVTFIPIPGAITILAGNYLFGPWLAFLYSFIGIFCGSIFAFFLGRKIGKRFVNWIVGDKETTDYYINKFKGKETIILFFVFLLPIFPDDVLCAIAGVLPISYPVFILMQLITRFFTIGGTLLFMSGEIIPYDGWGIWVVIILGILSIIIFIISLKNADKINNKISKLFNKKR